MIVDYTISEVLFLTMIFVLAFTFFSLAQRTKSPIFNLFSCIVLFYLVILLQDIQMIVLVLVGFIFTQIIQGFLFYRNGGRRKNG